MTPDQLAREAIALTESMDYVLADGATRLRMMTDLLHRTPPTNPDHPRLLSEWCSAYEDFFGHHYGLSHCDTLAANALLAALPLKEVMSTALLAWRFRTDSKRHPYCKHGLTMSGLAGYLDEIRAELGRA